jgi:hypothetical protein
MDAAREKRNMAKFAARSLCGNPATTSRGHSMPREFTPAPAVRAPEFPENLDWINTGNRKLKLADLRGKIVLLDFWTYG